MQLGTTADLYLTENYKKATLIRQKKVLAAAEDVKANKADCLVLDYLPALEIIKANEDLIMLEEELFTEKYGMAVKKGNKELLNSINTVLKKIMAEGKIEEYSIK